MQPIADEVRKRQRRQAVTAALDILLRVTLPLAVVVLSFAVLNLTHAAQQREDGSLCRARVNVEVAGLSDLITAKTTDLFNAAITHPSRQGTPSPEVVKVNRELEQLKDQLYPAIERRDRAVESCRR